MGKISKLEDLNAWIEARKLAKMLFDLANKLPPQEKFGISQHLRGNGRHIPANIAEGFGRIYLRDSVQFYRVAMGSLGEVKSDVYLCFDREYIDSSELDDYLSQINKAEKLINGLINSAGKVKRQRI